MAISEYLRCTQRDPDKTVLRTTITPKPLRRLRPTIPSLPPQARMSTLILAAEDWLPLGLKKVDSYGNIPEGQSREF